MNKVGNEINKPRRLSMHVLWGYALDYVKKDGVASDQIKGFVDYVESQYYPGRRLKK